MKFLIQLLPVCLTILIALCIITNGQGWGEAVGEEDFGEGSESGKVTVCAGHGCRGRGHRSSGGWGWSTGWGGWSSGGWGGKKSKKSHNKFSIKFSKGKRGWGWGK